MIPYILEFQKLDGKFRVLQPYSNAYTEKSQNPFLSLFMLLFEKCLTTVSPALLARLPRNKYDVTSFVLILGQQMLSGDGNSYLCGTLRPWV